MSFVLLSLVDVSVTVGALGFFHVGWKFALADIANAFTAPYSYRTSPLGFVLICLVRQLSLLVAISLRRNANTLRAWIHVWDVLAIVEYVSAVAKQLVFNENSEMLEFPGVYISTATSIVFTIAVPVLIRKWLLRNHETVAYQRLAERNGENDDSAPAPLPLGTVVRKMLAVFGKERRRFVIAFVVSLISDIVDVIQPWFVGKLMNLAIKAGINAVASAIVNYSLTGDITKKSDDAIWSAFLTVLVVCSMNRALQAVKIMFLGHAKLGITRHLNIELFRSVLRQDIPFFDENSTGSIVSRITNDTKTLSEDVPDQLDIVLRALVNISVSLPFMVSTSWQLTFVKNITFPVAVIITVYQGWRTEKLSARESEASAASNGTLEERISGVRTVRSFAAEEAEVERFTRLVDARMEIKKQMMFTEKLFSNFLEYISVVEYFFVYAYGGYLVYSGTITAEVLVSFSVYIWKFHYSVKELIESYSKIMKAIGSSRKVIELLNRQPTIDYTLGTETPEVVGRIVFEDVEFAYPTRPLANVLRGLNLTVEEGTTVALVGPSGNGKTTIISLIEQFYAPTSGRLLLDGTPIRQFEHEYFHSKVALVSQEPTLFSGTIRENIVYGMKDATEEEMMRAAEKANVHEFVSKMESGYETKCGEKGIKMSGGQKQRIAIARALIRNPRVLILDEATSALDAESEAKVQEALGRCAKEMTVIVIAHRLSTVRNAHKIAVIEGGVVVESGRHEQLMENTEGVYFKLVNNNNSLSLVDH